MNWMPDLTAALPAPRDDEPPELRRRIIAEVRDHLECAYQRELLLTGNAEEAIRRVAEKFGDPVQLARKLWFEALREKIMSQRLMLVCVGMLTAACMAMGIFSWKTAEQSALATQALVEHLDQLVLSSEKQRSLDWVDVKVKLVTETGEAAPEGFTVRVDDNGAIHMTGITVEKVSDKSGELDFGLFTPKQYNVRITSPWGEHSMKQFFVRAGEASWTETIVCPSGPADEACLQFDVDWPEEWKKESIALYVVVTSLERQYGELSWFRGKYSNGFRNPEAGYLIASDGEVRRMPPESRLELGSNSLFRIPDSDPLPGGAVHLTVGKQSICIWGATLLNRHVPASADQSPDIKGYRYVPAGSMSADGKLPDPLITTLRGDAINQVKLSLPKHLVSAVREKLRWLEREGKPDPE